MSISLPETKSVHNALHSLLAEANAIKDIDYTRTIELGEEAYNLACQEQDWRAASQASHLIAWGHNRLQNHARSVEPARRALDLAQQHGFDIETAYGLMDVGGLYFISGEADKALPMFQEAHRIAQRVNHQELMVFALNNLGAFYGGVEDFPAAIAWFEREQAYEREQGLPADTTVLLNLGMCCIQDNQPERGIQSLEQGYQLAQQAHNIEDEIRCRATLVRLLQSTNANDPLIDQHMNAAQARATELPHPNYLMDEVELLIAGVEIARYQYGKALPRLERIAAKGNDPYQMGDAQRAAERLVTVYEQLGDYPRALDALRQAHELESRLRSREADQRIHLLRTLYEVEETQRELAELKRTEAERLQREREAREQELNAAKRHIFARLSHEFRTPLAVIRSSTDLMTMYWDRMAEPERADRRAVVNRQYDALERLLNDMRALLRMDSSPAEVNHSSTTLQELLHAARQHCGQPERLHLHTSDTESYTLPVERIREILERLVSNALTFSTGDVKLEAMHSGHGLHFTVTDQGIGIPPGELQAVFEPLVRGSNLDEQPGIGVGLTLARHQAQIIGARITLESELGTGTQVTLGVPLSAT
jgi:signal transduction histidine kinase